MVKLCRKRTDAARTVRRPVRCSQGLKARYVMIIGVIMGVGLLVITVIAFGSVARFNDSQIIAVMDNRLDTLTDRIDDVFYELVGLTEQLSASGPLGKTYSKYKGASERFDKISLSSQISEEINSLMFSNRHFSMAGYFELDASGRPSRSSFLTIPMRDASPLLTELPCLMTFGTLAFQAIHDSVSVLNRKPSISVCKTVSFHETPTVIYVEAYMDVKDSLSIAGLDHGYPSVFAMLDEEGRVMYVSDDSYDTGRMLEEQAGHDASYRVVQKSVFGFSCILLMTHSSYRQFVMSWAKDLLLIVLVIVLTILLTVLFLYRLIYKPLRMFSEEVETICEGDLTPSTQIFDIREFDDLFVKIEEMKLRITQLMDDMHRSDNEKHRLKVDNLYYQINPHFLLNALNSLHWMAAVSGQENIVQYVHHLNSILSYSLGKTREMITFRSELRVAELYVAFQQARYDFDFTRDVEEGSYLDHPCARLILQPMLENAICHNMNEFGKLWLSMKLDKADTVRIEIIDDGVGMAELPEAGMPLGDANFKKGIGLKYLQYTLEANYGNCFSALIYPAQPSGVMIVLLLPLT